MATSLQTARAELFGQVRDPTAGAWFAEAAMSAVARVIGFDGWCLFAVDPLTGIRTVMFSRGALQCAQERMVHNETVEQDANRYADLATGPRPVGVLATSVRAQPRSPRLHDILVPEGFRSELRLVLVSGGRYWGALSLWRDDPRHPFTDDDAADAVELGDPLSHVVRRYNVGSPGSSPYPAQAGVVLVDRMGRILDVSPEAHAWLRTMADSWPDGVTEGDVMRMVYEVAAAASGKVDRPPLCRVRMPGGGWLVASGTRVQSGEVDVVVVLGGGDGRTVAPAFAAWCGLT
ncbi:MAG: GAF domain-containing protein, partial [Actinomycetota bacterium]|nr:GAF domain-containing protein [Actinomycetota bacterium]